MNQNILRFVERKIRREGIPFPRVAIGDVTIPRDATPPALPRAWVWQEVSSERATLGGIELYNRVTLSARLDADAMEQWLRDVWVSRLTRRLAKSQRRPH